MAALKNMGRRKNRGMFLLARREKICYDYGKWVSGLGGKGAVWENQILNGY